MIQKTKAFISDNISKVILAGLLGLFGFFIKMNDTLSVVKYQEQQKIDLYNNLILKIDQLRMDQNQTRTDLNKHIIEELEKRRDMEKTKK
jgi:hypothetical protein